MIMGSAVIILNRCVLDAITHTHENEPTIAPTVRFAVYSAELGYYQDMRNGHPDAAPLVEGIKMRFTSDC